MRLIASTTIVLMSVAFGTLLTPAARASAASLPICTSTSLVTDLNHVQASVPSVGGNTDCLLAEGNDNAAVKRLQFDLDACYGAGLFLDSDFGQMTMSALQAVQSSEGIQADGIYGPQTRDHILWLDGNKDCVRLTEPA
jgi:peptidoglycan hydrolase-like protein with peptidoglycan-binding domain